MGPRLHRVHQRPDLPVAVRRAQRVVLRHLGRDRRPDQRPRGRGRGRHRASVPTGCAPRTPPRCPPLRINAPAAIAKDCLTGGASFGPPLDRHRHHRRRRPRRSTRPRPVGRHHHRRLLAVRQPAAVAGKIVMVDRGAVRLRGEGRRRDREGAAASSSATATRPRRHVRRRRDPGHHRLDRSPDRETIRAAIAGGDAVNVTMKDVARRPRRLLPLADRRGVARLRRRDPRHVEPDLPRRPRQGLGRGVQVLDRRQRRRAQQLRRAQPRLRAAGGRRHLQRPDRRPGSAWTRPRTSTSAPRQST